MGEVGQGWPDREPRADQDVFPAPAAALGWRDTASRCAATDARGTSVGLSRHPIHADSGVVTETPVRIVYRISDVGQSLPDPELAKEEVNE